MSAVGKTEFGKQSDKIDEATKIPVPNDGSRESLLAAELNADEALAKEDDDEGY